MPTPETGRVLHVERSPRRRAQPHVPVHHLTRRLRLRLEHLEVHARLLPRLLGIDRVNVAQFARDRQFPGEHEVRHVAALRAALENAGESAHCVRDRPTLTDRHAQRLLAENVLPCARRQHRHQRMVVVARRDHYRVDVRPRQQFARINVRGAVLVAVVVVDRLLRLRAPLADRVAHGDHPDVGVLQERPKDVPAATADSDRAHVDALIRGRLREGRRRRRHRARCHSGPLQERSSADALLLSHIQLPAMRRSMSKHVVADPAAAGPYAVSKPTPPSAPEATDASPDRGTRPASAARRATGNRSRRSCAPRARRRSRRV